VPVSGQPDCFDVTLGGESQGRICSVFTGYASAAAVFSTDTASATAYSVSPDVKDVEIHPAMPLAVLPPWIVIERSTSDPAGVLTYSVGEQSLSCDLAYLSNSCEVVDP
jgi:hypothetical protein